MFLLSPAVAGRGQGGAVDGGGRVGTCRYHIANVRPVWCPVRVHCRALLHVEQHELASRGARERAQVTGSYVFAVAGRAGEQVERWLVIGGSFSFPSL